MKDTYTFTREQLENLLRDNIDRFIEYCDEHNKAKIFAKRVAVREILHKLDTDKEERLLDIQVHDD